MERNVFITGATGFLGGEILKRELLATTDNGARYFVLTRPESVIHLERKFEGLIDPSRVKIVPGDITEAGILRTPEDYASVIENADTIVHSAAVTSLEDKDAESIHRANVAGTSHVIDLARRCKNLTNFHVIGTAYNAGYAEEVVEEDALPPVPKRKWRNQYEYSKWQAEQMVRESGLPWTIFRPSIVIGESKPPYDSKGEVRMVYGFLAKLAIAFQMQVGRKRFIENMSREESPLEVNLRLPGYSKRTTKNFVCIDDVAESILQISRLPNNEVVHRTFNLTNPQVIYGEDMCRAIEQALNVKGIMPAESDTIPNPNDLEKGIMGNVSGFYTYMIGPDPTYSTRNTDRALQGRHTRVVMSSQLLGNMLRGYILSKYVRKS